MNVRKISLSAVTAASMLCFAAGVSARAQTVPIADHHAHLRSPAAALLLNKGASSESRRLADNREEKPQTAAALIHELDAAGIRRSVAISDAYRLGSPFVHVPHEADAVNAENDWTLSQVKMYSDRLLGICSVNPVRPYALAAIEHCASIGLRGGLKLHLANARFRFDKPAQVEQLRKVFAAADRLHLPILIHLRTEEVWHGQQNAQIFLEKVLPSAPHVPVQVAHLGGWGGYDQATDDTLSTFTKLCEMRPDPCRNLYFDLAAVELFPAYGKASPGSDERLLWDQQKDFADGPERLATNLRQIGLSRILFGTDWPIESTRDYIGLLRQSLRLSPAELNQILGNIAPYFSPVTK